jgi:hypothetical protein
MRLYIYIIGFKRIDLINGGVPFNKNKKYLDPPSFMPGIRAIQASMLLPDQPWLLDGYFSRINGNWWIMNDD